MFDFSGSEIYILFGTEGVVNCDTIGDCFPKKMLANIVNPIFFGNHIICDTITDPNSVNGRCGHTSATPTFKSSWAKISLHIYSATFFLPWSSFY